MKPDVRWDKVDVIFKLASRFEDLQAFDNLRALTLTYPEARKWLARRQVPALQKLKAQIRENIKVHGETYYTEDFGIRASILSFRE